MDMAELEGLAAKGDALAVQFLACKLAEGGNVDRAIPMLEESVAEGSIGAAEVLASIYMGRFGNRFQDDPFVATKIYAWRRVAQAMGDSAVFLGIEGQQKLTEEEYVLAEYEYSTLLTWLHERHQERYGEPLPFVPRPLAADEVPEPPDN